MFKNVVSVLDIWEGDGFQVTKGHGWTYSRPFKTSYFWSQSQNQTMFEKQHLSKYLFFNFHRGNQNSEQIKFSFSVFVIALMENSSWFQILQIKPIKNGWKNDIWEMVNGWVIKKHTFKMCTCSWKPEKGWSSRSLWAPWLQCWELIPCPFQGNEYS